MFFRKLLWPSLQQRYLRNISILFAIGSTNTVITSNSTCNTSYAHTHTTYCDARVVDVVSPLQDSYNISTIIKKTSQNLSSIMYRVQLILRGFYLWLCMLPALITLPLCLFNHDQSFVLWSEILKFCIQSCGPCASKLGASAIYKH
jgi:hypothetical protein